MAVLAVIESFCTGRRLLAPQVVVGIEAISNALHRRMLWEARLSLRKLCVEHNGTLGCWCGFLNPEEMMWHLTDLACKEDMVLLHSVVFSVGQIDARAGTIRLWVTLDNL